MVDGIKGRDAVHPARQLGIMTAHTNDCVGQEFAALCTKMLAVVTRCGVLETPSQP